MNLTKIIMIDLVKLFEKLRYDFPENRHMRQYSYSEMMTFAETAIKEQEQINLTIPVVSISVCYAVNCANNKNNKCVHDDYHCIARITEC